MKIQAEHFELFCYWTNKRDKHGWKHYRRRQAVAEVYSAVYVGCRCCRSAGEVACDISAAGSWAKLPHLLLAAVRTDPAVQGWAPCSLKLNALKYFIPLQSTKIHRSPDDSLSTVFVRMVESCRAPCCLGQISDVFLPPLPPMTQFTCHTYTHVQNLATSSLCCFPRFY